MMYFKNQVLACGSSTLSTCYLYNEANDTWNFFASGSPQDSPRGSFVYSNKLHVFHGENESVFDPLVKSWTTLHIGKLFADHSCTLVHQNTYMLFGSGFSYNDIYQYHTVNSSWIKLDSSAAPMGFAHSGCGVLPDGNILIVGSGALLAYYTTFAVYNVPSNTWIFSGSQDNLPPMYYSSVLTIGKKVFVITGTKVFEFNYYNKSIAYLPFQTFKDRSKRPGILKVHAAMFNNHQNGCKGIN
jgi:N-acetylneuraminic acid mutarotase